MKHLHAGQRLVALLGIVASMITCTPVPNEADRPLLDFKPTFSLGLPGVVRVIEERDTTLSIDAIGTPPIRYAWYRRGTCIGDSTRDSLRLHAIALSQADTYSVVATNDYGADTSATVLVVDSLFYSISVSVEGNGVLFPAGDSGRVRVRPLARPTFTFAPDSGNHVDSVFVNGTSQAAAPTLSQYTFASVTSNGSFRVVFKGAAYALNVITPINGRVLPNPLPRATFSYGDTIALTAVADSHYYFGGWGGDASGTDPVLHLVMNANKTISATFAGVNEFSLTATSLNGHVTLNPPGGAYSSGTWVRLTATPNSGYVFSSWSDSASGRADTVSVLMNHSKVVTANFSPVTYRLFVMSTVGGSVTTPSTVSETVNSGVAYPIVATAQTGYTFERWQVDSGAAEIAVAGNASTTVTLPNGDARIQAVFTANSYTLTLQRTSAGDTLLPFPYATVQYGVAATIAAKAYRGSHFVNWTVVDGPVTIADSMQSATTVTLGADNATILAVTAPDRYTLGLTHDNGTIAVLPAGKTVFAYGDTARLIAQPDIGHLFTGWSGDTLLTDTLQTSIRVTFVRSRNIVANFTRIGTYSLILSAAGGSIAKDPDSASYSYGDRVLLTAVPDSVHAFVGWSGDAHGTANPCTVTVDGNKNVTASFAYKKFVLTMQGGGHATTVPAATDSITVGTPYAISASPGTGYRFVNWSVAPVNAATILRDTSATTAMVTLAAARNIIVSASCVLKTYQLSASAGAGGSISAPAVSPVAVNHGAATTLIAVSGTGFSFNKWTVTTGSATFADSTASSTTATLISGDATIVAVFARRSFAVRVLSAAGGTASPAGTNNVSFGDSLTISATPAAKYLFAKWTRTNGLSVRDSTAASTKVAGVADSGSVTAVFTPPDTVRFNSNGGSPVDSQVVTHNTVAVAPTAPTRSGFAFRGWFTDQTTLTSSFAFSTPITSSVRLYAKWAQLYSVVYDPNGAPGGSVPVDNAQYATGDSVTVLANTGSLTRTYYTFSAWNVSATGAGTVRTPGFKFAMGSANVRIYARWTLDPPVITLDPLPRTVAVGSSVSFSVGATGDSLTYRWQKNGGDIGGAQSATYTKTNVVLGDAGSYRCFVQNSAGRVGSAAAALNVYTVDPGMRLIAGGTFQMGQVGIAEPVHSVTLSPFYMDTTLVTQADYTVLMGVNPSDSRWLSDANPVNRVTWFDVALYCNKRSKRDGLDTMYSYSSVSGSPGNGCMGLGGLVVDTIKKGYRMPTEAEWEYACRAGSTTICFWGDDVNAGSSYAWAANSGGALHPVALKAPNAWGLYDMVGNLWQVINDWIAPYSSNAVTNPFGPGSQTSDGRGYRGGSFSDPDNNFLPSANRGSGSPSQTEPYVGCRLVRSF
jgi:uncharacterized repeat protein (TIGR02543 family)